MGSNHEKMEVENPVTHPLLFKMQKSAVRIISCSSYNSLTEPLFKKLKILPLPDLITFSKIQFMQRFSQKNLPESFNDIWVRNLVRNIGANEIQLRNHAHCPAP